MAGVRRFQDLDCWKLARQLRRDVVRMTRAAPACHDFRFVSQIRDAARGGTRNIAEGFSRFIPTEILRFLAYAKASLDETADALIDGLESKYWSPTDYSRARSLLKRTQGAIRGWWRYLESPEAARFYEGHRRRIEAEIDAGLRRPPKDPESRSWRRKKAPHPEPQKPEPQNPVP
jgi:four helix bundle protein